MQTVILSARVPVSHVTAIDALPCKRTDHMKLAIEQYLAAPTFPAVAPTEDQRAGMRSRALMLMQTGREYSPSEAGRLMGCGECAASAYFRDLRKGKYGGHNIISRPEVIDGRRVSFYRMEEKA